MPDNNFAYDIFISYAHIDNQTISKDHKGWVELFHRALEIRLGQISGSNPKIWRDPKINGNDYFDNTILNKILDAAALVAVFSPRYLKSDWCKKELLSFINQEKKIGLKNFSRIFKVCKTQTPLDSQPIETQNLLGYEFYQIDHFTKRAKEFKCGFGNDPDPHFWNKLDDLAYDIYYLLEFLHHNKDDSQKIKLFLAETSSDMKNEYEILRRELLSCGYMVLPEKPVPLIKHELISFLMENLIKCKASIHIIGNNYGIIPEGSTKSIVYLQNQTARELSKKNSNFSRLIWISEHNNPDDLRQIDFIKNIIQESALKQGDDIVKSSIEDFKTIIYDKLHSLSQQKIKKIDKNITRVYLICEESDLDDVYKLEEFLFSNNIEVIFPLFDGDEFEISQCHKENLSICENILIYWGKASEFWLRCKLQDIRKSAAFEPLCPISVSAVYMASPETKRKNHYHSIEVDLIIKNFGEFEPEILFPFVEKVKNGFNDG